MDTLLKKYKQYERALVTMGFMTWGLIFMDRLAVSFLMPIIQPYFEINNTQVGMISFVTSLCYAISAIVFSRLADKAGKRKLWLVVFVLITAAFSGLGCFTQSYEQLLVVRALVGIGEGPCLPIIYALLANSSSTNQYGRNTGIVNAGVACIGATLGPIFVTQLVERTTWQNSFLLSSIPTFIMVVVLLAFVKENGAGPNPELSKEEVEAATPAPKEKVSIGEMLKYRNFVLCCLIQILGCGGYWLVSSYGSLYLVNISGFAIGMMGIAASIMGLLTIFYDILFPKLSDDFGRKPLCIIGYTLALLGPLGMYLFSNNMGGVICYVLFGGLFGAPFAIVCACIPSESMPAKYRMTAIAIVMGLGDFIGAACWPLIGGIIADARGLPFMMLCGAIIGVVAVVLCFFLKESHPRKKRATGDAPADDVAQAGQ
jgi:MFS family permease